MFSEYVIKTDEWANHLQASYPHAIAFACEFALCHSCLLHKPQTAIIMYVP